MNLDNNKEQRVIIEATNIGSKIKSDLKISLFRAFVEAAINILLYVSAYLLCS